MRIIPVHAVLSVDQKQNKETAHFHEVSLSSLSSKGFIGGIRVLHQQTKQQNNEKIPLEFYFTDLSTAGPPAELKHITQRRKRKQP